MFKHVGLALLLLLLSSPIVAAESNQQLTDILADNPATEINKLTENMASVLSDLPTSPLQTVWNAGVDSEVWDEARIGLLVFQVRDAEITLEKAEKYNQQYAYVFKYRRDNMDNAKQWLMRIGGAIFQMKKQTKLFEQRMAYLKKILPHVIKSTVSRYNHENNTGKTVLKSRLQAQLQCYQVMNFPLDKEIQNIQSKFLL